MKDDLVETLSKLLPTVQTEKIKSNVVWMFANIMAEQD